MFDRFHVIKLSNEIASELHRMFCRKATELMHKS